MIGQTVGRVGGIGRQGGGLPWTPAALFLGNSLPGFVLDPSALSSLWQDSAATTPVTAATQPVGRLSDLSGRGNHWGASGTKRPTYQVDGTGQPYLLADGVDDAMATLSALDLSAVNQFTFVAGVRKLSDAARGMLWEHGTPGQQGNIQVNAPITAGTGTYNSASGGSLNVAVSTTSAYAAPTTNVFAFQADIANDVLRIYVNGAQVGTTSADQGAGNFANATSNLFARAGTSSFFNGRLYAAIGIGRLLTTDELARATAWVNQRTGAY